MSEDKYKQTKEQLKTLSKSYGGIMLNTLNEARLAIMDLQEEVEKHREAAYKAVDALGDIGTYMPSQYKNDLVAKAYRKGKDLAQSTLEDIKKTGWKRYE